MRRIFGVGGSVAMGLVLLGCTADNGGSQVDACLIDNGGCGDPTYSTCTHHPGADPTCAEINLCTTSNGGCGDAAFWTCAHNSGASPTCTAINLCATNNGGCGDVAYWACTHHPGAAPTCADIDQCATDNGGCGDVAYWACTHHPGAAPTCADRCVAPSGSVTIPVVIRDFSDAHPDMEKFLGSDLGIVESVLGGDGKPVYAHPGASTPTTTGKAAFDEWFNNTAGVNLEIDQSLALSETSAGVFTYASAAFFPIDDLGWGNQSRAHNYHFTTELRFRFRYLGSEQLTFAGDDDSWAFINGQRGYDLGGVHGSLSASVLLDATGAATFSLVQGEVYELVVLQAERHTTVSNYNLTLSGFALCTPP